MTKKMVSCKYLKVATEVMYVRKGGNLRRAMSVSPEEDEFCSVGCATVKQFGKEMLNSNPSMSMGT